MRKSGTASDRSNGTPIDSLWFTAFSALFGAVLGLGLLKFGNPVILDRLVERPQGFSEKVFQPWPVAWGYGLLFVTLTLGMGCLLLVKRTADQPMRKRAAGSVMWLLAIWLAWQAVACVRSVEPQLSRATLLHFAAVVLCFFLGLKVLSRVANLRVFWIGLIAGFALVFWVGLDQHYGGLEATRRYFYEQPNWRGFPPEYLKKIASNRIFSTLVYPNALAGAILLLLPAVLTGLWQWSERFPRLARLIVTAVFAYAGFACLYWSGSKAGWLIALFMAAVALWHQPIPKKVKAVVAVTLLVGGLAGFFVKFAPYFQKGATSVSARFDYWRAAWTTAYANPIFGTGPGTFSVPYAKVKPPEAEMARLVHNDYLEQASDSGIVGFLTYVAFVVATLLRSYRNVLREKSDLSFSVWLGLFGWFVQGLVEFSLYIPALAWPAFTLLGLLVAKRKG